MSCQQADLIIRGGNVVMPWAVIVTDVVCAGGQIVAFGSQGWQADEIFDAGGLYVLPGVIDSQVHFREPGLTHKETLEAGTLGALLGGVTAVFEMPNTQPLTLWEQDLRDKLDRAAGRAWCDYAFYIGGAAVNAGHLAELEVLPGCAGVKIFMGSSFGDLLVQEEDVLRRILASGHRPVAVHAEDERRLYARRALAEKSGNVGDHPVWRDEDSALIATQRILQLAYEKRRRLHILHVSTAEEIRLLAKHKDRVSVEVTPHHLTLVAPDCYERLGTLAQMNPPVRAQYHQEALWQGVRDGVVDVLGSDHAPHTLEEKARRYPDSPSGMTGVQTLLPIMLDHVNAGRLTLERLVDLICAGPARLFGMPGRGRVAVGQRANLTIVDMKSRRKITNQWIASISGWTPYDGVTVTGWPVATILNGVVAMRDNEVIGLPQGCPIQFEATRG